MNCLKNSRSVLSRLLPRRVTTVSQPRPLPAQAPAPRYYYASRLPHDNAASRPPPQVPSTRYFFTSPQRKTSRGRRGASRWWWLRKIAAAFVIVGGGAAAIYLNNLEAVPYTNRTRFIIFSREFELLIGKAAFAGLKMGMEPKILPPLHPESVRVRRITSEIVRAAVDRGLAGSPRHEAGAIKLGGSRRKDGGAAATATAKPDDEERGNHGDELAQPRTSSLLDGWDVIVVRSKKVNAMCVPGGKIIVYTGLLNVLREDAEIATILGHEVAHSIARHTVERFTKSMWHLILRIVTLQFIYRPDVEREIWLAFKRSLEIEADHIGLLLLAAAGYDPRVAPLVYEKLGKIVRRSASKNYLSTHPSGKERAQHLLQDEVMNEALELYREVHSEVHSGHGKGTDIFAFAVVLYFVFCFFKG